MKRHLFNLIAVVSLLLCVVAVGLWVRSYFRVDQFSDTRMDRDGADWYWWNRVASSRDGGVLVIDRGYLVTTPRFADNWSHKPGEQYHVVSLPGVNAPRERFPVSHWFEFDARRKLKPIGSLTGPEILHMDALQFRMPYWIVVLVTGVLPAVWLVRRRREGRRTREGWCLRCGYDLRASPGRCPECGVVPSEPEAAAV